MSRTLQLLALWLRLAVHADPPDPADPPEGDDPPVGDDPAEEDPFASALEEDDPPAVEEDTDDPEELKRRLKAANDERARVDRELAEERTRRSAAPAAPAPVAPAPDAEAKLREEEDRILADPKSTEWQRWQINSSRTIRQSENFARTAMQTAQEANDKADYRELKTGPTGALAKKYEAEVEQKLGELRRAGGNMTRRAMLKMVIGHHLVDGDVKAKPKAPKPAPAEPANRVDRGRAASPRSDVSGRRQQSERDARMKRLEGRNI